MAWSTSTMKKGGGGRLSVGLEHIDDILEDIKVALDKATSD